MTQLGNSALTQLVKRSFTEMMKDVGTSIPGHILSFDPARQVAQCQIGIRRVDVNGNSFVPPPLIECPVYVYGGSFAVEVQIDPGTEGVIMFSQRCIDAWLDTGGVAENPILRFHDFSDAYFLPGLRSQPNVLGGYANDGVRLRNQDGSTYIWLKSDGTGAIKVSNLIIEGDVNHTGDMTHTGDTQHDGTVQATGYSAFGGGVASVTGGISVDGDVDFKNGYVHHNGTDIGDTHVHGGVTAGSAETDPPS